MAREKKPVHKVQMTDGKRNIIQQLLQEYDILCGLDIILLKELLDIILLKEHHPAAPSGV